MKEVMSNIKWVKMVAAGRGVDPTTGEGALLVSGYKFVTTKKTFYTYGVTHVVNCAGSLGDG